MEAIENIQECTPTDLGSLLDEGAGALVTLVAGDTRLFAHRAVLSDRSAVFATMFHHHTLESSSGRVDIADVEGPVLRQLVSYCYTLQAPPPPGMAAQLLAAADKYCLLSLKAACEQQLVVQMAVESAAATAVLAVSHCCPRLVAAAVSYIRSYAQVLATRGWADAVRTHPEEVVELSRLLAEPLPESGSVSGKAIDGRLTEVAHEGMVGKLRALVRAGVDMLYSCLFTSTALHCAAGRGDVEAARRLLEAGAEVDAWDRFQDTPLHTAAEEGHVAMVKLLTSFSADPNEVNAWGSTPLHCAAYWGHTDAAAALLEAGADKGARNEWGKTPLDEARRHTNKRRLLQMLT